MTTEILRKNLEDANKTRRGGPRTQNEINEIVKKFEAGEETRVAKLRAIREQNKGYHKRLNDLIKDNNIDLKDCRFYVSNLMGIFVHRKPEGKATVTFSFFNINDYESCENKLDKWSFKFHSFQNFIMNKYTYEVDWKGRSEFAVYDAFIKNHKSFPSMYKDFSIYVGFINPYLNNKKYN